MDEACFSTSFSEQRENDPSGEALSRLKRIGRFYTLFHFGFIILAILEIVLFLIFFSLFTKSAFLAFSIAGIFLTGFSYCVLLFYFQAKKPEQLRELKETFIKRCKEVISSSRVDYHTAITHEMYRFVHLLKGQEYRFYRLPSFLKGFNPVLEKFSAWNHWKETHLLKEKLIAAAIEEIVEWVKKHPTNLEAHASLATAYLHLARIYKNPSSKEFPWVSSEYSSEEMLVNFKKAAEKAIQEYLIIDAYAPNQLWTLAKLAYLYRELDLPLEEMSCYERMLTIAPDDHEVLFRLGVLYFEEGQNAKALRIYETLKKVENPNAATLISFYNRSFA